jgi:hypothetical protein
MKNKLSKLVLIGSSIFASTIQAANIDTKDRQNATKEVEPWIATPKQNWPQFVLKNDAAFTANRYLSGASGFLISDDRTGVVAVTAIHLLGENGGVAPEIPPRQLDSALLHWRLFPRTSPDSFVEVAGLGAIPSSREYFDWLVLKLKPSKRPLPATPLRLRASPVRVGETVHLIGVSYAEPEARQKVYTGKVVERHFGDRFRFSISPAVNLRGFSGAPIVDENGLVVGIMSLLFNPEMQGDLMIEAGGEDASSLVEALAKSFKK